jgi:anti-anti-sigma factor
VTAPRRLDAPTGLRPGDHVCWTFADATDFSAAVLPYLDEGRRLGEHLLLMGSSRPALLHALASLPERDEMLASGQLEVRALAEWLDPSRELDPLRQVVAFRRAVAAARNRGRTGLRVAADATVLAARRRPDERRQLLVYEGLADATIGAVGMTGLCLYDAALGEDVLGPVAILHPGQHLGGREALAHLSGRGPWLSLHGEVDVTEADDLFRALVDIACAAPGEVVLDLADLEFLDIAGARMLATATRLLAEVGVQMRLVRARRLVARCLELFDLGQGSSVPA